MILYPIRMYTWYLVAFTSAGSRNLLDEIQTHLLGSLGSHFSSVCIGPHPRCHMTGISMQSVQNSNHPHRRVVCRTLVKVSHRGRQPIWTLKRLKIKKNARVLPGRTMEINGNCKTLNILELLDAQNQNEVACTFAMMAPTITTVDHHVPNENGFTFEAKPLHFSDKPNYHIATCIPQIYPHDIPIKFPLYFHWVSNYFPKKMFRIPFSLVCPHIHWEKLIMPCGAPI